MYELYEDTKWKGGMNCFCSSTYSALVDNGSLSTTIE